MKNLNDLAKHVALEETGKEEVNIAQIKEIIKCVAIALYEEPGFIAAMIRLGEKHSK